MRSHYLWLPYSLWTTIWNYMEINIHCIVKKFIYCNIVLLYFMKFLEKAWYNHTAFFFIFCNEDSSCPQMTHKNNELKVVAIPNKCPSCPYTTLKDRIEHKTGVCYFCLRRKWISSTVLCTHWNDMHLYLSSSTRCSKVISKVKVFKKWVKLQGQGHMVKNIGTHWNHYEYSFELSKL